MDEIHTQVEKHIDMEEATASKRVRDNTDDFERGQKGGCSDQSSTKASRGRGTPGRNPARLVQYFTLLNALPPITILLMQPHSRIQCKITHT